jgi:type II secretory ATPase GspE/PulE/Tfp pilus assembly ATPase PilB-like protein
MNISPKTSNSKLQIANFKMPGCQSQRGLSKLQFAFFNLKFLFLSCTLIFLLVLPGTVWGAEEPSFPRGEGFYFNLLNLSVLVILYLCWVRTWAWIDDDARQLHIPTVPWNPLMLGCGLAGMLVVWLLPWFWIAFPILLALYLTPSLIYAAVRNQHVSEEERVLNEHHFASLAERFLRIQMTVQKTKKDEGPSIRFIGRSLGQTEEDAGRVQRASEAKGFKTAAALVHQGIRFRADHLHLEPTRDEMTVRFQVDGLVQNGEPLKKPMGEAVVSILKTLANLDLNERRKPQEGSFSAKVEKRTVDFRLSTAGSVVGEKLTLGIIDPAQQTTDLMKLGMEPNMRKYIRSLISQQEGMLLVAGPPGSGKTTTLYACVMAIDRFTRNVMSLESPLEHHLHNVSQTEVHRKTGQTFASEMPAFFRQDPDVVLIGSLEDAESVDMCCQAAQNGRMVLAGIDAPDAATALFRLIEWGLPATMIANAVSAVLAQRLVRVLCPKCKVRYKPNPEMLRKANLPSDIKYFYRPPEPGERKNEDAEEDGGICRHCRGMGFRGRTGVFELFVLNDRIRDLICGLNPSLTTLQQEAVRAGMRHLKEDGLRQVIEGNTFIKEYLRVFES